MQKLLNINTVYLSRLRLRLAKALKRKLLVSAILKSDEAFESMVTELKNAYTRAWMTHTTEAFKTALDTLKSFPPGTFGENQRQTILTVLEKEIGPEAMKQALKGPVMNLTEPLYRLGMNEVGEAAGVDIMFGLPDRDALEIIERGNLFWAGQHWNSYTYTGFHDTLGEFFNQGLTRDELAAKMAERFAWLGDKGIVYWNLMADHCATKTREIGRVVGYEKAQIEYVQIRAHIDQRTTEICRKLHGRIISVKRLRTQRDEYIRATEDMNPEKAKAAWPMMNDDVAKKLPEGKEVPEGIGNPPYHFRCRTITVIYYKEG